MPDASKALSLYAVRLRVTRLTATGAPAVGPDNMIVTDSLVRVDYEPTYETTDPVVKRNGRGGLCLSTPARSSFSGMNLTVEICDDDPMLYEMLGGGSVLTEGAGADVVGYQFPKGSDPTDGGVSLEVWTEAWSGEALAADLPYFRYLFPLARLRPTARSLAAETDEKTFEGTGSGNNGWGTGPAKDWTKDSTAAGQYIRTAVAPPAVTNGYAPVAA